MELNSFSGYQINREISVPKVIDAILSPYPITLLYGWRDGGKSNSAVKTLLLKCLFDDHFRWIHARKHYNELAFSTYKNLCDNIEDLGLQDYFTIKKDHFQIVNKLRPSNYFIGAGVDNPDKMRSTQNLSGILFEEFHDCEQVDFESILGTVRQKIGYKTKFLGLFNNDKVSRDSFIDKTFLQPDSPIKGQFDIHHISFRDNQFIDQEATEAKLKLICLNDMVRFSALEAGELVDEDVSKYYPQFSSKFIVENIELNENVPLLLSFDFNYSPCTVILIQAHSGYINFIKEFQAEGGTIPLCNVIMDYLKLIGWKGSLRVTGDSSGHKRDTRSGVGTDFSQIQQTLNIPQGWINYNNKSNTHLDRSRDLINLAFYLDLIRISRTGCPGFINDLNIAKPKDDKTAEFLKDRGRYKLDLLDAGRYGIHNFITDDNEARIFKSLYK